jgi:hypothetical protein
MGFLRRKAAGYKAAVRVERYRGAAAQLRESDPVLYAQVLAQADGGEAAAAASRDPDAYVALFLAAWDDEKGAVPAAPVAERDIDYWPTLNVDAVWADVSQAFSEAIEGRGATATGLYYPDWFVRRMVAHALMGQALLIRPELADEADRLFYGPDGEAEPFREAPGLDAELDAFLAMAHLDQIVGALAKQLVSAEE